MASLGVQIKSTLFQTDTFMAKKADREFACLVMIMTNCISKKISMLHLFICLFNAILITV